MYDLTGLIEALHNLNNGVDPFTGEVFDQRVMYDNPELARELKTLTLIAQGKKKPESRNVLNRPADKIFAELKAWRKEKAEEEGVRAFHVFSDAELWSIAEGDVCTKEQLLLVNGISDCRYEKYGNELFEILSDYIEPEYVSEVQLPETVEVNTKTNPTQIKGAAVRHSESKTEKEFTSITCDNCQLRKNGECSQLRNELCSDFKAIPYISDEERNARPTIGDASSIRIGIKPGSK